MVTRRYLGTVGLHGGHFYTMARWCDRTCECWIRGIVRDLVVELLLCRCIEEPERLVDLWVILHSTSAG